MKRYNWILFAAIIQLGYGQGLLNNGARIVLTSGSNVYIDGATGHYTSQNNGAITNASTGGTVTLLGNWVNNSANVAFTNDGATAVLAGANQTIGGTNATAFYNVNLTGSGTKQLAVNQNTVGGQSVFTGVLSLGARPLDLNSNTLNVTNSAAGAITNSTGYIISETNVAVNPSIVRWYLRTTSGAHIYPFGVGGTPIPFTFNVTAPMAGTSDYVSVSTRATTTGLNTPWAGISNVGAVTHMFSPIIGADGSQQVVIDRWWDITSASAVTANVTFSYRGVENTLIAPYNTGNLGAQHWDGSGWEPPVGSAPAVTAGVGAVTASGLNTFSPWVLSSLLAPLPIELTDFTANCDNNIITLHWATSSEKNNDYFTIERSENGIDFSSIAKINGSGNSNSVKQYSYTDASLKTETTLYYRLKQTDFNASSKTLKTITTELCKSKDNSIRVNNTTDGKVSVSFYLEQDGQYTINIYDVLGRQLKSQLINVLKNFDIAEIETSGLSEAYYILHIQGQTAQKVQKVYVK